MPGKIYVLLAAETCWYAAQDPLVFRKSKFENQTFEYSNVFYQTRVTFDFLDETTWQLPLKSDSHV